MTGPHFGAKKSISQMIREANTENAALRGRILEFDAAAEATLLFHSLSPWDDAKRDRWATLTGGRDATTKGLCDFVRSVREKAGAS